MRSSSPAVAPGAHGSLAASVAGAEVAVIENITIVSMPTAPPAGDAAGGAADGAATVPIVALETGMRRYMTDK